MWTAVLVSSLVIGCGKKGPPLPPLISLPAAPAETVASRRGDIVEIQFVAPPVNTDGSRPADLARVDVYGLTGAAASEDDVVDRGSRVGSVIVNPPPDPDEDPDAVRPVDPKAPPKPGIDQGAVGQVTEDLASFPESAPRSYVSVGVNSRGRRGPPSPRTTIPLGPAPPAPAPPQVTYTETTISVLWAPSAAADPASTVAYHVYDAGPTSRRLSDRALASPPYTDDRIEWGAERCYALRTVHTTDGLTMESAASSRTCVRLTDTFPPAPRAVSPPLPP
ncbi:MAG: hypothetical protein GEU82_19150, partial [Luteitalea sp.]|nr:hypothetical protein [Luteitalea sp.]